MTGRAALAAAVLGLCAAAAPAAAPKSVAVFVALADNAHQGIVPVPAALGNGDDPERNLYWGAGEGLRGVFDRSAAWILAGERRGAAGADVPRVRVYRRRDGAAVLSARAYRGPAIRACLRDFEEAVRSGGFDLVAYVGHNGLMDFDLPPPGPPAAGAPRPDVVVLCCRSAEHFGERVRAAGGRPVLLTTQLMYPGSFLLRDALDAWLAGAGLAGVRESAAAAYAANQRLSRRAALGVFADLGP